ncbi:MAG: shikimate kinase AroK [Gammaproteobacteria bacterium]|nr:shikimate kinase AroK [Gammaproteobacteria bacterium]
MQPGQSVFLVGPMGVGKTSIGRHLAELLDYQFLDSDHEIELRSGVTIPWIFDVEGETGFRKREQAVIDELTQLTGIVLATGGGAVIRADNRQALRARGLVIYLKADVDSLVARIRHDKNRPLLQIADPRQRLEELIQQREPWYQEIADGVFNTNEQDVKTAARELFTQLQTLGK